MLSEPVGSRTSVFVTLSCHQQAPKAAGEESVESPLFSGIGRPRLAAIKESRQDTSLVDAHLGPFAQQVIAPHSLVEFDHDSSCFGDPASSKVIKMISASSKVELEPK